jgi:hypothetical protein
MPQRSHRFSRLLALLILLIGLALGAVLDAILAHQLLKRQHQWAIDAQLAQDPHPWIRGTKGRCPTRPHWAPGHGHCVEA